MISRKLLTLVFSALVAFSVQCSWQTAATNEEKNFGVVRFPEAWLKTTVDGSRVALTDTRGFTARRKSGAQPAELIFTMKGLIYSPERGSESVHSDAFYAVSLDGNFRVRAATADEWDRAEQLANTRQQILSNRHKAPSEPPTHTDEAVLYQGKDFPKSGKFWGNPVGLTSPNGAWLAVFSFSSSAKPSSSWSPLSGAEQDEPRPGEMFVDVYDTSFGQRIQSGRTRYDSSPSMLFGGALWIGDSYLVVPLDPIKSLDVAGQACFLGILPSR